MAPPSTNMALNEQLPNPQTEDVLQFMIPVYPDLESQLSKPRLAVQEQSISPNKPYTFKRKAINLPPSVKALPSALTVVNYNK